MYVCFPLHKPPSPILESQIPPTMNKLFKKFLASYLFAYLMLGLQILIVMLMFVEHLTPIQFLGLTGTLWLVCSVVLLYLKSM